MPQHLEESHNTKQYNYDIAYKSNRILLPDLNKKNHLRKLEDTKMPGEGVMFPEMVPEAEMVVLDQLQD